MIRISILMLTYYVPSLAFIASPCERILDKEVLSFSRAEKTLERPKTRNDVGADFLIGWSNNEDVPDMKTFSDERKRSDGENLSGVMEKIQKHFLERIVSKDQYRIPPFHVEDNQLLMYDIFLILNLSVSISILVIHRLSFDYLSAAISEGSLMSILWIISGLFNGGFLRSSIDGHHIPPDPRAGPKGAGLLGLHSFIMTSNLRLIIALLFAIYDHRKVGTGMGEDLMPMEITFGVVLMSVWRLLHSAFTPRV
jgi:hypothetical protein